MEQKIRDLRERSAARRKRQEERGLLLWVVLSEWAPGGASSDVSTSDHLAYQLSLEEQGILFAAGPLAGATVERFGGLIIIRARDRQHAESIAATDPLHKSGARTYTIFRWTLNEGHVRISFAVGAGNGEID